jgi:hypothetical protein
VSPSDFGTAIYTNCGVDQGLDGVAGMQFQSRSTGVDREALAVIRRHLIYEPPDRLIQERQPVEAFPLSFAHAYDGVFATAAGVYIGREAQGARQGNHLTHAIVTDDARAYRSLRPVQLFEAPFWRAEPADSKQSERLGPEWQPGPFDAASAGRFVRDQPDGPVLLSAILTALLAHLRREEDTGPLSREEDAEPRRVLFVSDRPDSVLLWLTAATLLIPQQEAVRLGFKVFTSDPASSALPVVAVHPDWVKSAATVEHDRGYVVFDLVAHRWTELAASAEASHWAQWFCQADPYEVSEAVELARASGLAGETARDLAAAAVLHQPPARRSAGQLARWLETGPPALREAYGGSLATGLAQLQDLGLLRQVDSAADKQFPGRRDQIRLALLRLELDNARRNPMVFQPDRPRRPVSPAIRAEAERLVTGALQQAQRSAFDAVLRVSNRFEIAVPLNAVHENTTEFVTFWADNPDVGYEPSAWPSALPVNDMLRDELSARIGKEPELADRWYRRLNSWAPDIADLTSPLERELLSAAMANSDPPERMRIVRSTLRQFGSGGSPRRYHDLLHVLWRRTRPSLDELRELCSFASPGDDLDPAIFSEVLAGARGDPAYLPGLELCGSLAEKGLLALDPATEQLLADHRWLRQFERQFASTVIPGWDEALMWLSPGILNAHAEPLARGLLAVRDPLRVQRLLSMLPEPVVVAFLRTLRGPYPLRPFSPADLALMVAACARLGARTRGGLLAPANDPAARILREINSLLDEWCGAASKRKIRRVTRQLIPFGDAFAANWERYAYEMSQPWWWRLLEKLPFF